MKKTKIAAGIVLAISAIASGQSFAANDTNLGINAGVSTFGRCNDGAIPNTPTLLQDPTFCNTHGGWLGNSAPDINGNYTMTNAAPTPASTSIGAYAMAGNLLNLDANGNSLSTAVGFASTGMGIASTALGAYSSGMGNYSTAVGVASISFFNGSAFGYSSRVDGQNGIAIGANTDAGFNASAIGVGSLASGLNSVALGYGSQATIGNESYTNAAQLNGATTLSYGELSVGNATNNQQRRVSNVAAGYNGTDAVNVSQLNSGVTNAITNANDFTTVAIKGVTSTIDGLGNSTASALGGGSTYNSVTGAITPPSITTAGVTTTNVTDAIQGLNNAAVQYSNTNGVIDKTNVTLDGVGGTTIHNVKDGILANDVASYGQVQAAQTNAVTTANNYTDTVAGTTLTTANNYTNTVAGTTLTAANNYTDLKISGITFNADSLGFSTATVIGGGSTYDPVKGVISSPSITAGNNVYSNITSAIQGLNDAAVQYNNQGGNVDKTNITLDGVGGTAIHNVKDGILANDVASYGQVQAAQTNAVTTANNYTDTVAGTTLTTANNYTNTVAGTTLTTANNYTNFKVNALTATTDALGNSTASALGGGSFFDPVTGIISNPTIRVGNYTYTDSSSAIEAISNSSLQYDKSADGSTDNSNLTLQGANGTIIHNLGNGVAPSDAATVGQSQAMAQTAQTNAVNAANRYTDNQISGLSASTQAQIAAIGTKSLAQYNELSGQIKATGSIASAMSALVPNPHTAKNLQAQASVGYGNGAAAIGAGATYQLSNDVLLVGKMAVSTASGVGVTNRIGGAVGVSFGL
jgi:hypothetical protein